MSSLRCTACDLKLQAAYESNSVKIPEVSEGQSHYLLSSEDLETLCRLFIKGRSSKFRACIAPTELPFCQDCQTLIAQIHSLEEEIKKLSVLVDEAIASVKSRFQESLKKYEEQDEKEEASSVTKARRIFLGLKEHGRSRRDCKGGRLRSDGPKDDPIALSVAVAPAETACQNDDIIIKKVQDESQDTVQYDCRVTSISGTESLDENNDQDTCLKRSCGSVDSRVSTATTPEPSKNDLKDLPDNPKNDSSSATTSTSSRKTRVNQRRSRRRKAVRNYSTVLKDEVNSDEENKRNEDEDEDEDWVIDEDEQVVERTQRKCKKVAQIEDENEVKPGNTSNKRQRVDSRLRKTARRRLDIKETEPGIFEWKGVKFKWLDGGRIECSCNKVLKSKLCLIIHIRKIHLREGVGEYPCRVCGKSFERLESLRVHEDIHSERRHQCNFCGKLFHQQANLSHHLKSHGKELQFHCDYDSCGKKFLTARQLRVHSKRHEGVKPFQCEFCSRLFVFRGELTAHLRSHAEELPFQCHLCDSKFFIKFRLRRHWKNVHKLEPSDVPEEYHQEVTSQDHPLNRGTSTDDSCGDPTEPELIVPDKVIHPSKAHDAANELNVTDGVVRSIDEPENNVPAEQVTILLKIM